MRLWRLCLVGELNKNTNKNLPKMKLSGLKIEPNGPARIVSRAPGSRSTNMLRGTYFPPETEELNNCIVESHCTVVYCIVYLKR